MLKKTPTQTLPVFLKHCLNTLKTWVYSPVAMPWRDHVKTLWELLVSFKVPWHMNQHNPSGDFCNTRFTPSSCQIASSRGTSTSDQSQLHWRNKQSIVAKYPHLFQRLGFLSWKYISTCNKDAKPYTISTPGRILYTVDLPLLPKLKEELNRMEQKEVIMCLINGTLEWLLLQKLMGNMHMCWPDKTEFQCTTRASPHPICGSDFDTTRRSKIITFPNWMPILGFSKFTFKTNQHFLPPLSVPSRHSVLIGYHLVLPPP